MAHSPECAAAEQLPTDCLYVADVDINDVALIALHAGPTDVARFERSMWGQK